MTLITIEELQKLAAAGEVSLPRLDDSERVGNFLRAGEASRQSRSERIAELMQSVRDLTKNRSPEQTAELERWLEERETST